MNIGELIKKERELRGLSLRDLEDLSGVNKGTIHSIETGATKDPGFNTLMAIAKCLDLVDALFFEYRVQKIDHKEAEGDAGAAEVGHGSG